MVSGSGLSLGKNGLNLFSCCNACRSGVLCECVCVCVCVCGVSNLNENIMNLTSIIHVGVASSRESCVGNIYSDHPSLDG